MEDRQCLGSRRNGQQIALGRTYGPFNPPEYTSNTTLLLGLVDLIMVSTGTRGNVGQRRSFQVPPQERTRHLVEYVHERAHELGNEEECAVITVIRSRE